MSEETGRNSGNDGGGTLRWLLTYADMITLLMAFFIMLYSMSILNLNSFKQVAVSIRSGFNGPVDSQKQTGADLDNDVKVEQASSHAENLGVPWPVVKSLRKFVKEENLEQAVRLRVDERGLVISLVTDKVLFNKGQAELSPSARKILDGIGDALKKVPNSVCVEGHTCNLPVSSTKYPSNWELSTARATVVVRYLIEKSGIPADRLSAAGYSDRKPLVQNTDENNRALNRRVDLVVLKTAD
ncbi:MAG TPA: flagellar motor protein MotB [Armatimonadota bacterium]|nr:flagellar motor protein MotB [Armatimonadota bacterium]